MSLNDWEKTLQAYCSYVSLLCEIPLTRTEIDQIEQHLQAQVKRSNLNELKKQLDRYPCTWLIHMSAVAACNDDPSYWRALGKSLKVTGDQLQRAKLGDAFLAGIRKLRLPDFADAGGYPHVTPIRLHGGIPAYSLPDFFEYVLLPAVENRALVVMTPAEQIEAILSRSTASQLIDSPVHYYLKLGGDTAVRFFTSCKTMAQNWLCDSDLPSPQALGLSAYVVDAFRYFMEGRMQTKGQKRLRPPRLLIDPLSSIELFRLELPPEPVDDDRAAWRHFWKIYPAESNADRRPIVEQVRVRQNGYERITEKRTTPLEFPPGQVIVEIWATPPSEGDVQPERLGRWRMNLAPPPGQAPLLAFRFPGGQALHNDQSLPADVLWLLYPRSAQIKLIGDGQCVQKSSDLLGDWADWRVEKWNLTKATSLSLETKSTPWPLVIRSQAQEPRLEGGTVLAATHRFDEIPFYAGEPPHLWFPRTAGRELSEDLGSWCISVSPCWSATPDLPESQLRPLSDGSHNVAESNGGFEFPLDTLLGPHPMGLYIVVIKGPDNVRIEKRLRIWPQLELHDWRPYYLPGPHGSDTVVFSISMPPDHCVLAQRDAEGITVASGDMAGWYTVSVEKDRVEAPLFIEAHQRGGETVRVTFSLNVARLCWKLTTNNEATDRWSTAPIQLPVDKLLQSQTCSLTLELATDVWPDCCLALTDAGDITTPLQKSDRLQMQPGQQRLHISLAEFVDTLRLTIDCPVFEFSLMVGGDTDTIRLPLMYLNRSLGVTATILEWSDYGTRLHWEALHRLRNRRVRLWSAWQLWTDPYEYCIPDDICGTVVSDEPGSGVLELPDTLPPGWYWVALRTAPSWEKLCVPPEPTQDAMLAKGMEAEQRLTELDLTEGKTPETMFRDHLEMACIFDMLGRIDSRNKEIQWLFHHVPEAYPAHLFTFYRWLKDRDPYTQRAVCIRMCAPELLRPVLTNPDLEVIRKPYLAVLAATKTIRPESARLILQAEHDPDLVNRALDILLKQSDPCVVDYLLGRVSAGAFSEHDAFTFLKRNAQFALQALQKQPNSSIQERLILALLPLVEDTELVPLKYWVQTEAGWGCIQKILLDDREMQFFYPQHQQMPVLTVILRPGEHSVQAEVDLKRKRITFAKSATLYKCTQAGCAGFISLFRDDVTYEHNRVAHDSERPAFQQVSLNSWQYRAALQYTRQQPAEMFA
jgi:hypothetical protein